MDEPTMEPAESELDTEFERTVEEHARRRGALQILRETVLSTVGRDAAAREVRRARAEELSQARPEPPPIPDR